MEYELSFGIARQLRQIIAANSFSNERDCYKCCGTGRNDNYGPFGTVQCYPCSGTGRIEIIRRAA